MALTFSFKVALYVLKIKQSWGKFFNFWTFMNYCRLQIMKNLFPEIYITFIKTYFYFFSTFPPKKLLKMQRYRPRMVIGTEISVILILQPVFKGLSKSSINRSLIDH